jgi:filamentous hemagglutinin
VGAGLAATGGTASINEYKTGYENYNSDYAYTQSLGVAASFSPTGQGTQDALVNNRLKELGWLSVGGVLTYFGAKSTVIGEAAPSSPVTVKTADVWSLNPTARGVVIESRLAQTEYSTGSGWYQVGAENNGYFPLVDFQKGNTLVSLKSVDTSGTTWMARMEQHIEALGSSGATVNSQPANMVLDLRVPPGGSAAAEPLIKLGENNNVTVKITEFVR